MRRKLLVVDDAQTNRLILARILSGEYTVLQAANGVDALAILKEEGDDIAAVLLDIVMPGMDGYEVMRRMGEDNALAAVPVIVTTGNTDSESEVKALSMGANDFITKPYMAEIIRHRVRNTIKLRETAAMIKTARRDELTGLLSRAAFFTEAAAQVAEMPEGHFLLACVDIDSFKLVNDQYGTEKGDQVIKTLAELLQERCDEDGGLCGHIAADNFVSLYPAKLANEGVARPDRLEAGLRERTGLALTLSVGRYPVTDKRLAVSAMYDRAKLAQATVKGRFDANIAVYDESMRDRVIEEQDIIKEMGAALENGEFEVWYQPLYNHATGALIGAEALSRWKRGGRDIVMPSGFIPVFERSGFIYELDKFVWERACRDMRGWIDSGRETLPLSVNISRYDIFRADFIDTLCAIMAKYDIPVELLRLEITETAFARSTEQIIRVVRELVARGFIVEIDDFGSGYSALNTLKDVPAQVIKLDMRFLENDDNSDRGGSILQSVVRMAKWLGVTVIAEGVETSEQAEYLRSIGCCYLQGFLYARPMPLEQYRQLADDAGDGERMEAMETIGDMDSSRFWDPKSLDTLIFNSFVGGACIFEWHGERIEIIRANEKYAASIGGEGCSIEDSLAIRWEDHMDEKAREATRNAVWEAVNTGAEITYDAEYRDLPGASGRVYLRTTFRMLARAGDRWLLYATNENLTAQRQAETKEREAAAQLSAIMENIDGGVCAVTFTDEGKVNFLFANERYYTMFGYTREQFEAEVPDAFELVHPEDLERIAKAALGVIRTGQPDSYRYRCVKRDGSVIHVRCNAAVTSIEGVSDRVHLSVITDVTKTVLAEESIRELNESMLELMNDTPGGFARMRLFPDGFMTTVYVNEPFARLRGMTVEDILREDRDDAMQVIHPDDLDRVRAAAVAMVETGRTGRIEYRLRRGDGSYIPLLVFARATKNSAGEYFVNAYYSEMNESEKMAMTVRESLPFVLSAIMENSTDMVFAKDRDFKYICCSPGFVKFAHQNTVADVVGKTDYDFWPKDIADRFRADDAALLEKGEPMVDYIEPTPSDDGVQHYCQTSKYLLRDSTGEVIGLYGLGRDITGQRTTFDQLKLLTDTIPGGLASYASTPEGTRITYFNDGFCNMMGYSREEYQRISSTGVVNITFEEDVPEIMRQLQRLRLTGEPADCIYRIHKKDGSYIWVNLKGSVTERRGDICYFSVVIFDITKQKEAEEALKVHEEEMQLALAKMSRIFSEFDVATRIMTFPGRYADKYGLPQSVANVPESMQGPHAMDDETFAIYKGFYESIIAGKTPPPIEVPKRGPDGSFRWERMTAYIIFDDGGRPVKALVAADDTTEEHARYELESSRPTLGEANLIVHALFDVTTGETLEYATRDGETVPTEHRTAFLNAGDNLPDIIPDPEERARYRELNDPKKLLERFAKGETELSLDYRRWLHSGDKRWVRNLLRMVRQPGGSDVLLFEFCYDINEEKTRELMLASLIESNYDCVARINCLTGSYLVVNDAELSVGVPPEEGDDADELARSLIAGNIHPDDREMCLTNTLISGIRKNLENNERFQYIARELQPDGSLSYKKMTYYYLDRDMGIVILTREDVTGIMREEAEKNALLADALKAANQANRAKSQFLSRMSHELRTPMNAIIGLAALSASDVNDPRLMEDNIGKIGISARYLLSLINDILEMSRIESGRMTLNEAQFDFEAFLSEVNTIVFAQAEAKGVDYDAVVNSFLEPAYIGDATKLQEILMNVLSNAVKFTSPGGKVTLSVEQLRCVNKTATMRFTVSDTGVGIDEEFLPQLFDPFSQESGGLTSSVSGTGLGLAITKNLAEMMNGSISVRSIKHVGSVFTVEVQLGISELSQHYLDLVASMNLSRLRALVVDDDAVVCRSTQDILKAMGMQAEWADSGARALERVKAVHGEQQDFNAIFIDWKMPDMDGVETTRRIRKVVGPEVTIIIMTAYDWRSIEQEAKEAGVDMFMEKPLFQSSIVKAFERVFLKNREALKADQTPPDFTGKRILMAEDHPLNAEIARRLLEKVGAEVVVASNGLECMETFTTAADMWFDAILMDIRMPVMDGLTATRNIRALKKKGSKTVPIVAMTANAFDEDVEISLSSGMDAHLAKPIEPGILYSTLQRLMNR